MIGGVVFGFDAKSLFIAEANRHDACQTRTSDVRALIGFKTAMRTRSSFSTMQIGEQRDPSVLCRGPRRVDDPNRRMW
jgi:hypothetical protein